MRLFIAVDFDNNVKDYLYNLQNIVKSASLKGNFTLYDNFHLTLKFIGEVEQYEVDNLYEIIDDVCQGFNPFNIKIGNLGSFNRKDKHLIYVDVLEGKKDLDLISQTLQNQLYDDAFIHKKERFKPHITIAREVKLTEVSILSTINQYDKPIKVNQIVLFESKRNKNNQLIYEPIYTKELG